MDIPDLPLPSNPKITLHFRMPIVEDALSIGNATRQNEEEFTTRYLNRLQSEHDSATWTVSDRRAVLFWIWCNSRLHHGRTLTYTCTHCDLLHQHAFDLRDIAQDMELLQVPPFVEVNIPVNGTPTEWVLKPMTGRGAEELQRMYANLPPKDDPNYRDELTNVKCVELALQAHLKHEPEDFLAAGELRYAQIKSMSLFGELPALVASVKAMKEALHHGLPMKIVEGEPMLYAPPHTCPVRAKEGETKQTRLFFPFRNRDYLPNAVISLMDDDD